MAKVLVLGANGFIGSHLTDALVAKGHDVRAFDRFGSKEVRFEPSERAEVWAGDYLNQGDLSAALEGVEYVFHFISTTTPATAENDPTIDIETNIRMSVELFKLCVEKGIKRVIFASTGGAIYGNSDTGLAHKETDIALPVSPYAIGKLTIEHYLRYFRSKHGLESTVFRISNPYGERQPAHRKQGVVPIFLDNLYHNRALTVLGDGSMVRDYIYVKDVASLIAGAFEKENIGDLYNLGSGQGNSISDIVSIAAEVTGVQPTIETRPAPSTFVQSVVLDTSRFLDDFGPVELTGLREGMLKTYEYIKQQAVEKGEVNA